MSSKLLVNTEQTSLLPPKKTTITEEYTTARCDRKHLNNKIWPNFEQLIGTAKAELELLSVGLYIGKKEKIHVKESRETKCNFHLSP